MDNDFRYDIAMLYIATFGRAPDSAGLDYWVYDSGLNIDEIAESFFDQTETKELYPNEDDVYSFIVSVYQNLFNREPDSAGLDYWVNELNSGRVAKSQFILAVINGALGDDKILLENKTEVGLKFADDGFNDIDLSYTVIDKVSLDDNEVVNLLNSIDELTTTTVEDKNLFIENSYIDADLDKTSDFSTYGVEQLDSEERWGDNISYITYSFNTSIPSDYGYDDTINWQELNSVQKDAVRDVMSELSDLLAIDIYEVADDGMLRFNIVDTEADVSGYSYYPGDTDLNGDIFLSQIFNTDPEFFDLSPGSAARSTIAHEIGHALGLKHPFEGYPQLPDTLDDTNHTVMSYTYREDTIAKFNYDSTDNTLYYETSTIYPDLYSLYDVEALQAIYGVNQETNLGDNIYTLNYFDYKMFTIWDSGGNDTIDLSDNKGDDVVDLRGGSINSADIYTVDEIVTYEQNRINDSYFNDWIESKIEELYSDGSLYLGQNNLSIPEGVIIENIYTGEGNDTIIDNKVNNNISTSSGNDAIYLGNGGYDKVDGGTGYDTIYLDYEYSDIDISMIDEDIYILKGIDFAAEISGVEEIYFMEDSSNVLL